MSAHHGTERGDGRADGSSHLPETAKQRHEEGLRPVTTVIREAGRRHHPVTIQGVAKAAGVSPSWIYTEPDIYEALHARRAQGDRQSPGRAPTVETARRASQQKRSKLLVSRLKELTQDNPALRSALAVVRAELRRMRQLQSRQTVRGELQGSRR